MSSFRIPAFLRPRRSFNRLRSFHLTPAEAANVMAPPPPVHAPEGGPISLSFFPSVPHLHINDDKGRHLSLSRPDPIIQPQKSKFRPANLVIPLRGSTVVGLAVVASLCFIIAMSFAFLGAEKDEPYFKKTLDEVAERSPGIVLLGESVDVDVDEPSLTIRWSIVACGEEYMLPGSAGAHGSNRCGLPDIPLHFYVDSDDAPTAEYNPEDIPYDRGSGRRRHIQNLVQFDSDHVLDVHEARLYPFDTYMLTSTIRAEAFDNVSVPIRKIATIGMTSSFDIVTQDMESYSADDDLDPTVKTSITDLDAIIQNQIAGAPTTPQSPPEKFDFSRDIDVHVSRPNEARFFSLGLFVVAWILAHVTVGHVLLARRLYGMRSLLPHVVSSAAILVVIPQLRGSMPDAPGFDGVLIDSIGYFPQMVVAGVCTITLILIMVVREFDALKDPKPVRTAHSVSFTSRPTAPRRVFGFGSNGNPFGSKYHLEIDPKIKAEKRQSMLSQSYVPPPSPNGKSTSREIAHWEMHRMAKQLKGHYVFPPVKPTGTMITSSTGHRARKSDASDRSILGHRKVQTMSMIMEAGEVPASHWSGHSNDSGQHEHYERNKNSKKGV